MKVSGCARWQNWIERSGRLMIILIMRALEHEICWEESHPIARHHLDLVPPILKLWSGSECLVNPELKTKDICRCCVEKV